MAYRCLAAGVVGNRGGKIAAKPDEHFRLGTQHCFQREDHIVSMDARRLKAEPPFELIEELWRRLFGDPHGAIALDVGVAAHRTQAGAGPADVAAQQREVGDLLDSLAAAPMLGYAHAVDQNYA